MVNQCQAECDPVDLARSRNPACKPLEGEIKPGQIYIWEPDLDCAETVIVTRVESEPPKENIPYRAREHGFKSYWRRPLGTLIYSRGLRDPEGREVYNDESKFREACVRSLLKDQLVEAPLLCSHVPKGLEDKR